MHHRVSLATLLSMVVFCAVGFASLRSPSPLSAATLFSLALATLAVAVIRAVFDRGRERGRAFWSGFALVGSGYFLLNFGPWSADAVGPRLLTTALLDILYPRIAPPAPATPAGGFLLFFPNGNMQSAVSPDGKAVMYGVKSGGIPSIGWVNKDGNWAMGAGSGGMMPIPLPKVQRTQATPKGKVAAGPPPLVPVGRWEVWTEPDRESGVGTPVGRVALVSPEAFRRVGHCLLTFVFGFLGGVLARHRSAIGDRPPPDHPGTPLPV